jgi:DNA recombination protein RmuC
MACPTDEDSDRDVAMKRHLDSVRSHVKGLSDKNYQEIHGVNVCYLLLVLKRIESIFSLFTLSVTT